VLVLEATVRLVWSPPARSLLVLGYPDVYSAGDHILEVLEAKPVGLEGMDDRLGGPQGVPILVPPLGPVAAGASAVHAEGLGPVHTGVVDVPASGEPSGLKPMPLDLGIPKALD